MSDTASDAAAKSHRDTFIRFGVELTFRCRTLASPRYDIVVYRGEELPTGWVTASFRFTGARTVPLLGSRWHHPISTGRGRPRATIYPRKATRV
jgi:hypothetical protein